MGHLTDDMSRLRAEITRGQADREKFCFNMKRQVAEMQANFHRARVEMSRKTAAQRRTFVSQLQRSVAEMRRGFLDDIQGAHRAFFSPFRHFEKPFGPVKDTKKHAIHKLHFAKKAA